MRQGVPTPFGFLVIDAPNGREGYTDIRAEAIDKEVVAEHVHHVMAGSPGGKVAITQRLADRAVREALVNEIRRRGLDQHLYGGRI